jgi:1-deoxy-D-xylulose-5-phosphate reductoisomerase
MGQGIQQITVLGATGSIGVSTLDVLARHPERYCVYALTAHSRWELLAEQCVQHRPRFAVIGDEKLVPKLNAELAKQGCDTEVCSGLEALEQVSAASEVDTVMAAIVGAAGLLPTLAAAKAGKKVLLANKEALVMAGGLFMSAVAQSGATLLPIDSEHNAIFQCLPERYESLDQAGVRKILLTASGGPFRQTPLEQLKTVSPDQACAHPNWSMGRKISVDSASMMNKGLELVEACWLFNCTPNLIDIVIHPQSVIHSMVQYRDGSVLAQLGNPDMRTPIAHALAWPERIDSGVASLDLIATARLDFEAPDLERFPCLRLAIEAAAAGQTAPAVLNAANEVAVEAFLAERIRFDQIPHIIESTLGSLALTEPVSLDVVQDADQQARMLAAQQIKKSE